MAIKLPKHTKRAEANFYAIMDAAHELHKVLSLVQGRDAGYILRRLEQVAFEVHDGVEDADHPWISLEELDLVDAARTRVAEDHGLTVRTAAQIVHSWSVASAAPVPIDPYKP